MSAQNQPTFLVSAYSEPVVVRINGKANYLNCNEFREFMNKMVADGKDRFVIDLADCAGMDSTFLGILAGTALQLREQSPPGLLVLRHLNQRNHDLVENLGLHNLLTVGEDVAGAEADGAGGESDGAEPGLSELPDAEVDNVKQVLEAHENLVRADGGNAVKFQDVIAFLKNQVEQGDTN